MNWMKTLFVLQTLVLVMGLFGYKFPKTLLTTLAMFFVGALVSMKMTPIRKPSFKMILKD